MSGTFSPALGMARFSEPVLSVARRRASPDGIGIGTTGCHGASGVQHAQRGEHLGKQGAVGLGEGGLPRGGEVDFGRVVVHRAGLAKGPVPGGSVHEQAVALRVRVHMCGRRVGCFSGWCC